ncbi:hypothetical protein AGLY_001489 [Aphis glycines]|uniref:DUF4806 domain-containing protein n=1 Tax=Aphis glycines TaxID=307491 RepID=A0A6G0U6A7_APHGL|nr:hypothetical protein AGLY_001489 [Aphis glycines]
MDNSYSKQWVVGYFANENKYSVVPVKWIIFYGNVCFCKWPNKGNVTSLIFKLCEPENDWPTYSISIVSEYFDDYTDAVSKERELFASASKSEKTPHRTSITKKKRKIVIDKNIDSDESDDCLPLTPFKISKTNSNIISCSLNTAARQYNTVQEPSPGNSTSNLMSLGNLSQISQYDNTSFTNSTTTYTTLSPLEVNNIDISSGSTNENNTNKKLLELQMLTLEILKRIDAKLELLEMKMHSGKPLNNLYDEAFLSLFPFKTIESINNAEERLKAEKKFERQLSYYINQIGGTCVKNFVKRVFTKLFTNKLATKFSWTGFRQNQALQNLKIVNIIKDTAINTFQTKESDFENHVKDWFRHALQRLKREEEKIKV